MTPAQSLSTSLPLRAWLRQDPGWSRLPLGWRLRQAWLAGLGSLNAALSAGLARQDAAGTLPDPVLIVGPWRSGTTVMHELLAAATGCPTPLTWQCMNACAFRMGRPAGAARVARPMDGLPIDDLSPQEDEFALLTLGADTAYRAFWMPHRLGELGHTLDPAHWLAHPQWLSPWESFLRGVQATAGPAAAALPLLLKSPNHSYRIDAILRRFPRARLIWMVRDPDQVFHSNRKMWTAMFTAHGITDPRPGALDDFLVRAIEGAARILSAGADRLPAERFVAVAHDDLLIRPAATVAAVVERLALPRAGSDQALQAALARTAAGRVERHATEAPVHAASALQALATAHAEALARRGVSVR